MKFYLLGYYKRLNSKKGFTITKKEGTLWRGIPSSKEEAHNEPIV
jgi:hypothetical protein